MKKAIAFLVAAVFLFTAAPLAYADTDNSQASLEDSAAAEDNTTEQAIRLQREEAAREAQERRERLASEEAEKTRGLYNLMDVGNYNNFTNYVDGYSLWVEKDMQVDMSYSGVGAVLENDNKRIEIYKQNLAGSGKSGYITYSNKFLQNTYDHSIDYDGTQQIGSHNVNLVSWHRDKLARVDNDKNYYLCMDIVIGGYAYTIFVKSNAPLSQLGGYNYLVENFYLTAQTRMPFNRTAQVVSPELKGWNEETLAFYNQYFGQDADLTWGIFEPDASYSNYYQLQTYENYFDYQFPILLNYSEFQKEKHPNLKERLELAYSNGKALELTLQTTAQDNGNMMYDILQGEYDIFLYDYAEVIKDFAHPVLFRLLNEMNGDWCPYSSYNTSKDTMIYKEVYWYVDSIFEEVGVDNAIWIWNPNEGSFPDFKWNHTLMYYPGDEFVDVVGMTAYNTGTYYASTGETWQEFKTLYDNIYYDYCRMFEQPLMITEFASANMGGDKNQWVINMFNQIEQYSRIKVAVWWDGVDWDSNGNVARSYIMDETPELLQIFKTYLKDPWFKDKYA